MLLLSSWFFFLFIFIFIILLIFTNTLILVFRISLFLFLLLLLLVCFFIYSFDLIIDNGEYIPLYFLFFTILFDNDNLRFFNLLILAWTQIFIFIIYIFLFLLLNTTLWFIFWTFFLFLFLWIHLLVLFLIFTTLRWLILNVLLCTFNIFLIQNSKNPSLYSMPSYLISCPLWISYDVMLTLMI
jgi:hypothetical protein